VKGRKAQAIYVAPERPQRGSNGVDVREGSGGRVGKCAAFRRQVNAAGVALKEFGAKTSLQCPDVVRRRHDSRFKAR
jgi:hypothetical protein